MSNNTLNQPFTVKRGFLLTLATVGIGSISLLLVLAMVVLGVLVYQQSQLAATNTNRSERPFTQVQRETLNMLSLVRNPVFDAETFEVQRGALAQRVTFLQQPQVQNSLTEDSTAQVAALIETWETTLNPLLVAWSAAPQDATLRRDLLVELTNFETHANDISTRSETMRQQAANDLNQSTQNLLIGMGLTGLVFVLFLLLIGLNIYRFIRQRERARRQLNRLTGELEQRVAESTRDLEIAAEVSQQVSTVLDLDTLLSQVVEKTRTAFDLYQVYILLAGDDNHLRFVAGTDEQPLLMKELSIDVNAEVSLNARAARTRKPLMVNDVSLEPAFLPLDNAPLTRSELVVPLLVGDKLLGVLDVQSTEAHRFTDSDLRVMSTLAGQVAVAVQNARLFADQLRVTEELRALGKLKSMFLANMSHELRTPLNSILNFTEFVADGIFGEVNEQQVDALRKAIASGEHLLSLINDLLDLTKIESGMMDLFIEQVNLNAVIQEVIDTASGLLRGKPVALVVDIDDHLPIIAADKRRVRQILINLVANAIKFTPSGNVTLGARAQQKEVHFTVTDTGVGIAPEDQKLVFETFRQTKHGITKGGTGLGLPICKYLAEAHGGRVWLESAVGKGSTFHVIIPQRTVQPQGELITAEFKAGI